MVVPARGPADPAQDLAAQRRPRRREPDAGPRRLGALQAHREPLVRLLAVRRAERDHGRAALVDRARGRHVRARVRLARRGTSPVRLKLSADSSTAPGELSTRRDGRQRDQTFIDRGRELDTDDVLIQNPDQAHPNRLVYRSPELDDDVRMSGTPWVDLRMSIDNRNAANLTAVLVDYGPRSATMVTRGWLDPQNRHRTDRSARSARAASTRSAGTSSPTTTSGRPATGSAWSSSRPTTTTRSVPTPGPSSPSTRATATSDSRSWEVPPRSVSSAVYDQTRTGRLAQLVRAPALQAGGRPFEPGTALLDVSQVFASPISQGEQAPPA